MQKRGISPLIATVLIIGFTIALGVIVVTWGFDFTRNLQTSTETAAQKQITCGSDFLIDVKRACVDDNKISIVVENLGKGTISMLNVRLIGTTDGILISNPGISPYGIGSMEITLDPNTMGSLDSLEVIPVVNQNGEEFSCSNTLEKIKNIEACPDPGLIQYFNFDDNVDDWSGRGQDGINNGATFVSGVIGKALSFDGTNYVDTLLDVDQSSGNSLTMCAWVYPFSTSSGDHDLISTDNGGFDWAIDRLGANWRLASGSGYWTSGFTVDANKWQQVCGVWESSVDIYLYKNGIGSNQGLAPGHDISDNNLRVADNPRYFESFDGIIDEVRIYNYAKTFD